MFLAFKPTMAGTWDYLLAISLLSYCWKKLYEIFIYFLLLIFLVKFCDKTM
jgi:hypothetical protein